MSENINEHNPTSPPGYHWLKVKECRKLTEEAVQIFLDVPDEIAGLFHFKPGQYLDIAIEIKGQIRHRSYSICSGPGEPLSIAVKQTNNGIVSSHLNRSLQSGDHIAVSKPRGFFVLNEDVRRITLFAAGSGITPLFSMLKYATARGADVTLIYGNQTASSIMFAKELSEFEKVKVIGYLSREVREGFQSGRITAENLSVLVAADPSILEADAFYICGPEDLTKSVRAFLENSGCPAGHIHQELFVAPLNPPKTQPPLPSAITPDEFTLNIILEGDKFSFREKAGSETLLQSALKHGLEAPFSCNTGVCGSCRAKVLKGSAVMKANYALTEEEVKQGYVLTCQSQSTCSELLLSYDA